MNLFQEMLVRPRRAPGASGALFVALAVSVTLLAGMVGRADAACYYPGSNCNAYANWTAGQTGPWLGTYASVFNIWTKQPPGTPGRSKSQRTNTGGSVSPWYSSTALTHTVDFPNAQDRQLQCKNSSALSNQFLCAYNGI
jgi:hypothetical protein